MKAASLPHLPPPHLRAVLLFYGLRARGEGPVVVPRPHRRAPAPPRGVPCRCLPHDCEDGARHLPPPPTPMKRTPPRRGWRPTLTTASTATPSWSSSLIAASAKESPVFPCISSSPLDGAAAADENITRNFREDIEERRYFWPRKTWAGVW
ncbi:hypothetical protein DFH09DRAFT_609680 [Mycena vulgaris]|nr:hypothetical protein DFH09DRAFT_609680 [Mycena vulgaris]